jgi:hypothetical protein
MQSMDEKPTRRWFQFSLRRLLIAFVVVSIVLSWLAWRYRIAERREAIAKMGRVYGATTQPKWRIWLLGDDWPAFSRELVLEGPQVTDDRLAYVGGLSRLQGLHLYLTPVTDDGLAHLRSLRQLKNLQIADSPGVTAAGLAHVEGLRELTTLGLYGVPVTDASLVYLANLPALKTLRLTRSKITDAGMVHFKGLRQLNRLDLTGCQITDDGIAQLRDLKQLARLYVEHTEVSYYGARFLQSRVPNLLVIREPLVKVVW